jgi:hypothetical protein
MEDQPRSAVDGIDPDELDQGGVARLSMLHQLALRIA